LLTGGYFQKNLGKLRAGNRFRTPLVWSHAEYIILLKSFVTREIVDRPSQFIVVMLKVNSPASSRSVTVTWLMIEKRNIFIPPELIESIKRETAFCSSVQVFRWRWLASSRDLSGFLAEAIGFPVVMSPWQK